MVIATNIPKNTAVLLRRSNVNETTTLSLDFVLADEDVAAVGSNLFQGKIKRTAIPAADARVYLLVKYKGNEKFYWMKDEYDENCSLVPGGGTGGYVKCDANKCYLRIEDNASPASSYSFRFEGTTGVEEVEDENGEVKNLYITKDGVTVADWTKWELSSVGAAVKVTFNFDSSMRNDYGLAIPAYFAYDDVAVVME